MLTVKRVDIACIQETHNGRTGKQEINKYIIFFGGNDIQHELTNKDTVNNKKAGAEIAIGKTGPPPPFVKGIYSKNGRTMEIRLKTGNSIKNISILNSYAPHTGYPTETIEEYLKYMESYTSLVPNNLVKIWCADNDGQLSQNETSEKYIRKWTLGNKLDNINSQNISKNCENNAWVARNANSPPMEEKKNIYPHGIVAMAQYQNNWNTS